MRTCAITMVHNEARMLPIWLRYYGQQVGAENLIVCDNDSTDGSTANLGVSGKIRIPRDAFDDTRRAEMVSALVASMLTHYDTVIYTDCDEFLVADPAVYPGGLQALLASDDSDGITPIGVNVVQHVGLEGPIDPSKPILGQRRWVRFASSMCKTVIVRKPVRFQSGFHSCDLPPKINRDLYLFHLKRIDLDWALERQAYTRDMAWANPSHGAHQRAPDEEVVRVFNRHAEATKGPFDFSAPLMSLESRISYNADNNVYSLGQSFLHNVVNEVPDRFFGMI